MGERGGPLALAARLSIFSSVRAAAVMTCGKPSELRRRCPLRDLLFWFAWSPSPVPNGLFTLWGDLDLASSSAMNSAVRCAACADRMKSGWGTRVGVTAAGTRAHGFTDG